MKQGQRFGAPPASEGSPLIPHTDSWNKETDTDALVRSLNPYELRPRRRTNVDRYEPGKGTAAVGQSSPGTKRSRKRRAMIKRNNSRVDKKFHAKNVKVGRLTSNANLGIFKRGRTSEPTSRPNVSYLNFSETMFLGKEVQSPEAHEEEAQASHRVEKGTRNFSREHDSSKAIEKQLSDSLGSCWQLNIPYEDYTPVTFSDRCLSVEDLKELYNKRNRTWPKIKSPPVYDSATRRDGNLDFYQTGAQNDAPQIHATDTTAGTSTQRQDMLFDLFLESVECFDEDVAMEILDELVDVEETNSRNHEPRPVGLHVLPVESLPNPAKERSCLPSSMFKNRHAPENPVATSVEKPINFGMAQEPYDYTASSNALKSWHLKDRTREKVTGDYTEENTSGRDEHQFGRNATSVCTTGQPSLPTPVRPALQYAATETTPHRRFWRCNKLY